MNAPVEADLAPLVLTDIRDGICTVTMNRGERYNPLSTAMIAALDAAFDAIAADAGVRVVVLAGSGRAFCAGHDLTERTDLQLCRVPSLVHVTNQVPHGVPLPRLDTAVGMCPGRAPPFTVPRKPLDRPQCVGDRDNLTPRVTLCRAACAIRLGDAQPEPGGIGLDGRGVAEFIGNTHDSRFDITFRITRSLPGNSAAQGRAPGLDLLDLEWRHCFLAL